MFTITRPTAPRVPSKYPCLHDTQLYDRKSLCRFFSASRQVSVYYNQPGGDPHVLSCVFRSVTFISDSLQAIRTGQIPQIPVLLGGVEDEGTIFAPLYPNVTFFLGATFGRLSVFRPPNVTEVNSFYPGLNDTQILDAVVRDVLFRCPTKLWSEALVTSGIKDVYRYTYGAKFPNLQSVNDLGVWHGSELFMIFATFSKWTASADEIELSKTLQTAFANFVKDPSTPPAPNWSAYNADASVLHWQSSPTMET